jgi:hypothetical protein
MIDPVARALNGTMRILGRFPPLAPEILMPGLVLAILWPVLRVAYDSEIEAFLVAFLVTLALRLAIKAEMLILTAQSRLGRRVTFLAALAFGPGLLAFLVFNGNPIWCQRFLSAYFLVMAAMFLLDVIDGRSLIASQRWPEIEQPGARRTMSQVMVIYHLGMLLANESLIESAGYGNWLVFFGYMPLISHLVVQSALAIVKDLAARRNPIC